MTTTDRFEPYLEPLYVPAFFGWLTLIFDHYLTRSTFLLYVGMIFSGLLILTSILVIVYEFLLFFRRIKPRALIDGNVKIYKFIRWIFGAVGLVSVLISVGFILALGSMLSSGPWDKLDQI